MARTVASLIGGRAREGAPGGTLEIPNPTRLVDVVATARLGDPTTFVRLAPQPGMPNRAGRACRHPFAAARSSSSAGSSRTPRRSPGS